MESISIQRLNGKSASPPGAKPLFIGVCGGTASGKTSLCQRIAESFEGKIAIVSLDSFYKGLT